MLASQPVCRDRISTVAEQVVAQSALARMHFVSYATLSSLRLQREPDVADAELRDDIEGAEECQVHPGRPAVYYRLPVWMHGRRSEGGTGR
jgi:hypothetical protein